MKQFFQSIYRRFLEGKSLLVMLYVILLGVIQLIYHDWLPLWLVVANLVGIVLVAIILGLFALPILSQCNAYPRLHQQKYHLPQRCIINICFYLIPLAVFMIYFIAYYPGGWTYDTYNQYLQALDGQYNDWHPVLHTLLTFKLPLVLTNSWIGSVVLFQSLCFCGVISYACQVIRKYFGILPAAITMAWILLNPVVMLTAMHPWKDVGFAICTLLLATYALQTVITRGQWLHSPMNAACFVVVAVIASIFRHNGILFVAPMVLGIALTLSWKRALTLCISVVLLFATVKGPLYMILDVEQPDQRQVETLGLPMSVIGSVATVHPELLDKETQEFIDSLASEKVWEEFQFGDFNSVKFTGEVELDVIEEYGAVQVLSIMLRCFKVAPKTAVRSVIALTGRLYCLYDASLGISHPNVGENPCGIKQVPNQPLIKLCTDYANMTTDHFSLVFMSLGIIHLILVLFILAKLSLKRRQDWSRLLIVLSVFCYNFGSGLLLSSCWDSSRFFFYTFPLLPILTLIIFCNQNERSKPLFAWFKK